MSADIEKLYKRVEQFCKDPSPLLFGESNLLLNDIHKACFYEEDPLKRNKLEQLMDMIRRSSATDVTDYAHILRSMAFIEYNNGNTDFAEYLYRRACNLVDDYLLNNNLAYILRRKKNDPITTAEIITLLLPGVREQNPFCMINMALLFALNLSGPDDWHTADELFSLLPDALEGADAWWESLAKEGDIEGYLVFFFLLRHKITGPWNYEAAQDRISAGQRIYTKFGSIKSIAMRLSKNISGFPSWLSEKYQINSLDDVLESIGDPDYFSILEDFVKNMPCSRETVDILLDKISHRDERNTYHDPIDIGKEVVPQNFQFMEPTEIKIYYNKLLSDCVPFLAPDELQKLKAEYKVVCSAQLPNETE